jgi:hypothetical protein
MRRASVVAGFLAAVFPGVAQAQETTTYTYDAKGRVTGVTRSGGPDNGVATSYSYDQADNRTNVTVTGAPNGGGTDPGSGAGAPSNPKPAFVVVPLNGYTLIFLK